MLISQFSFCQSYLVEVIYHQFVKIDSSTINLLYFRLFRIAARINCTHIQYLYDFIFFWISWDVYDIFSMLLHYFYYGIAFSTSFSSISISYTCFSLEGESNGQWLVGCLVAAQIHIWVVTHIVVQIQNLDCDKVGITAMFQSLEPWSSVQQSLIYGYIELHIYEEEAPRIFQSLISHSYFSTALVQKLILLLLSNRWW